METDNGILTPQRWKTTNANPDEDSLELYLIHCPSGIVEELRGYAIFKSASWTSAKYKVEGKVMKLPTGGFNMWLNDAEIRIPPSSRFELNMFIGERYGYGVAHGFAVIDPKKYTIEDMEMEPLDFDPPNRKAIAEKEMN